MHLISTIPHHHHHQKSETCDVLTGKPMTSVYFDPSHVVDKQSLTNDADWLAEHLYDEAALIKEDEGLFTLKLRSGIDAYFYSSLLCLMSVLQLIHTLYNNRRSVQSG